MLALTTIGLVTAAPAQAAPSQLTGTGPGTASITLSAGPYKVSLHDHHNTEEASTALFGALLDSAR